MVGKLEIEIRDDSTNGEFAIAINGEEGEVVEYGSASYLKMKTGERFVALMDDPTTDGEVFQLLTPTHTAEMVDCDFGDPGVEGDEASDDEDVETEEEEEEE
jgi:hypothetical protein